MQKQQTISRSDCDMRQSLFYTTSNDHSQEEAPKHFPSHCHYLVACWSDPLELSESQQNYYIWGVHSRPICEMPIKLQCLQPALVNRMGPILHSVLNHVLHNQSFKSWMNWATKICLIHCIHLASLQWTTTSSSILTTYAGKTLPLPAGDRKYLPKFVESWSLDFYTTGINKNFLAKICWLQWFLFWLIKMYLSLIIIENS